MIAARFKFRGPEIAKTRQNQPEIQLFANLTNLELEYFNQTWSICVSLLGDKKKQKKNFPSRSKVMVIKVEIRSNRRNRPQHYLIHLSYLHIFHAIQMCNGLKQRF